jgi:hypothetical protein
MEDLGNMFIDLEVKYELANTIEEKKVVLENIVQFLKKWKSMENKIIEKCLKMAAGCCGELNGLT